MCIQIADTGESAIFLEWLIMSRGNFRGIISGMISRPKGKNVPAATANNIAATTVTANNNALLLLLLFLLLPLLLWY